MIRVKTKRQINRRVFKNTIGRITNADFENYGVGDNPSFLKKLNVYIDNIEFSIMNTDLELAGALENHGRENNEKTAEKEQITMFV